jgi:hypothetical protein
MVRVSLRLAAECLDISSRRSKIVENLAAVNYDTNNLVCLIIRCSQAYAELSPQYLAPYDWRLSYHNLEVRDGYFSRLKTTIEGFKSVHLAMRCLIC